MLAVFSKSVAKSPEGLQSPESNSVSSLKDAFLAQHFSSLNPSSVTLNLASSVLLAYSLHKNNPLLPRYQFLIFFLFMSISYFFIYFLFFYLGMFEKIKVGTFFGWFSYPFDPLNIWWSLNLGVFWLSQLECWFFILWFILLFGKNLICGSESLCFDYWI